MELTKKNYPFHAIAGGLFIFLSVLRLIGFHPSLSTVFFLLLNLAGFIVTAVMLFMKRRDVLQSIGFGILSVMSLLSFFSVFIQLIRYFHIINLLNLLVNLINLAGYVCALAVVLALTGILAQYGDLVKKVWFLPSIFPLLGFVIHVLQTLVIRANYGYISFGNIFLSLIHAVILAAAMACTFLWLMQEEPAAFGSSSTSYAGTGTGTSGGWSGGASSSAASSSAASSSAKASSSYQAAPRPAAPAPSAGSGYIGMGQHVLLLLLTCGIWQLIWIYRTTEYLNRDRNSQPQTPVNQLLLCMFVPFYSIYWVYTNAKRVDSLAGQSGIPSDLTTICVIMAVCIPVVAPIIMQDKINAIATTGGSSGGYTQNPASQTTGYTQSTGYTQPTGYAQPTGYSAPGQSPDATQSIYGGSTVADPRVEELKTYKELLDKGVITQEEYDAKKRQILGQ